MHLHVRAATATDLPAVLAIYNDAILNTTASYHYAPLTLEERTAWWTAKGEQGLPLLVAEAPGQGVTGWATYGPFRAWEGYRFTVEDSVYVAAGLRGQGIGKALLAALVADARHAGYHAMLAAIDADNAASLHLHAQSGFVKVAHFRQIGFKFQRWLDLVFMQLLLEGQPD